MSKFTKFIQFALCGIFSAGVASAQTNLTVETSGAGASNYAAMITLGEIASESGIAEFQFLDDQVLTNSLLNVTRGQSDIVPTPFILPFLLSKGGGPYADVGAEEGQKLAAKAAVLFTYSFGGLTLYSYDSSTVDGWDDIAGKKILNGPPQGAALSNARAMIQIITGLQDGKDYEGVQANWGQMVKTITDGSAAAMVLPVYLPDARMIQASASGAITVFSVPRDIYEGEAMQKYLASPGSGAFEANIDELGFPDGIKISSEDNILRIPATVGGMVVSTDMDEELAYRLTKAHLDNLDRFEKKQPFMKWVSLGETDPKITGMCGANPINYHPGAVRAYEESGYSLPDCAMP